MDYSNLLSLEDHLKAIVAGLLRFNEALDDSTFW